eukprot:TRINITY_DN90408_c0_g1_i1.p2 TRINITY_DN90408_c0_g1~~TRINITY_DN90408_c0_g1_i1.p2  ORF type:complete len:119 (+),score=17.94 TRINITY_DN90408_c0_g1_i1:697-1053(+)
MEGRSPSPCSLDVAVGILPTTRPGTSACLGSSIVSTLQRGTSGLQPPTPTLEMLVSASQPSNDDTLGAGSADRARLFDHVLASLAKSMKELRTTSPLRYCEGRPLDWLAALLDVLPME